MKRYVKKRKKMGALFSILLILITMLSLVSCDSSLSDLRVKVPESWTGKGYRLSLEGPTEARTDLMSDLTVLILKKGDYSWSISKSGWTTGPVAEGRIALTSPIHEIIVTEPELSRVTVEIESDTDFRTTLTAVRDERSIAGEKTVMVREGEDNRTVFEDMPEGLISFIMTDENGIAMPALSFDVVKGEENLFTLFYRKTGQKAERSDVTFRVSSNVSMDSEILWRRKGAGTYMSVPFRVLRDSTSDITVRDVPVGDIEVRVKGFDGDPGDVKVFTVLKDALNLFKLETGTDREPPETARITVRMKSDEDAESTLCVMGGSMTAPRRHPVMLDRSGKVMLLDWKEEGIVSLWLETPEGREESRTELYVAKGMTNSVTLTHFRPVEEENTHPSIPEPEINRPPVTPEPAPKWGKLILHIKANSTDPCILWFLYPGDTVWRQHETRFNGMIIGKDYEFNEIPPGRFRYTFSFPGEDPFPVETVMIMKGDNSAHNVYFIEPDPVEPPPQVPEPEVPLPEPDPAPEERPLPPLPQPEEPEERLELRGKIRSDDYPDREMKIMRFINESDTDDIRCTWYVDGRKWCDGRTLRIMKGQGKICEVWVTSPATKDSLVIKERLWQ